MPLEHQIIKNSNDAKMGVLIAGSAGSVHILRNILRIFYQYGVEKRKEDGNYQLPLSVIAGIHHVEGVMFGAEYLQKIYIGENKENPVLKISTLEEKSRVWRSGVYIARASQDTEISPTHGIPMLKDCETIYHPSLDKLLKTGANYFEQHGVPYCPVMIRGTMSDGVVGFSEAMKGKMAIAGIVESPDKITPHSFGEMPRNTIKRMKNILSQKDFNTGIILARGEIIGDILIYQMAALFGAKNGK